MPSLGPKAPRADLRPSSEERLWDSCDPRLGLNFKARCTASGMLTASGRPRCASLPSGERCPV